MEDVLDEGKDLSNFLWEMIKHTKDILMYKVSKRNEIYSEEEIKQINEIAEKTTKEELINIIYRLSELENKMKTSSQKTIIFETEIIKLCVKEDTKALEERVTKIEKQISEGKVQIETHTKNYVEPQQNVRYEVKENKTSQEAPKDASKETKKVEVKPAKKLASGSIMENWQDILGDLKKQGKVMLYANLIGTEAVETNDMTVEIRFNNGLNSFRKELLQKPENMNSLTKAISVACGKTMNIKLEDASGGVVEKNVAPKQNINKPETQVTENKPIEEDELSALDIPINYVEE